ncbi:BCCT family transporter [Zhihengliuella halotolerans]|uniref:Choline/carnitine/betaine transport n=1 Tax=Zhihengliuella halotolerans TaxID=370736 RepID=A0A4V2GA10_9MICC|nr:BCCT family transporter [Zhihengliuella halotolerans]RZU62296.1 choline/carnitine/betaine transport [Zhihengliuella halotolerans]
MTALSRLAKRWGLQTSSFLFFVSAGIVVVFAALTIAFVEPMGDAFGAASTWLLTNLGWFYIFGVSVFLLFLIYLAISRWGRVRLSEEDEGPEHSDKAWFAMLFAAGIGTILMFWAVAEPVNHFANPPRAGVEPSSIEAAQEAMGFTLYHFGLHTWTIFTLPGLAFAYFIHKRRLPPRVSSMFQPFLGEKIHGPIGRAIDVIAIVGTVLGVAVSIGLGTLQINAGLSDLLGISESAGAQLIIIGVVTGVAILSVAAGLNRGIKVLSNTNILVAIGLLLFVLITGPTLVMIKGTVESAGTYLFMLPELMFWNDTFHDTGWQGSWTVFYWAWTITWSPFVGIFIAKISKGRTIRQFITGVLGLPTLFTIVWFGIFGMGVFDIEMNGDGGLVERVVDQGDIPGAMFEFLTNFPLATLTSFVGIVLVAVFFITSMDSAGLVLDTMTNGHEDPAPTKQRVFWTFSVGLVAAALLIASGDEGLSVLQDFITVVGLPFFVLGFLMMANMLRALKEDAGELPPLRTRRWLRVLPPEEWLRRRRAGTVEDAVMVPEPVPGTEPEYSDDPVESPADADDAGIADEAPAGTGGRGAADDK